MSDDSRAELIAGAVVLAVAAGFLAFAAGPRLMPGGGYDLIAAFPNVEGIEKGSEIRLAASSKSVGVRSNSAAIAS